MKKKVLPAKLTPAEREEMIRLRAENERITTAAYDATARRPSDSGSTAADFAAINQRIRHARDLSEDKIRERKCQRDRDYDGPSF